MLTSEGSCHCLISPITDSQTAGAHTCKAHARTQHLDKASLSHSIERLLQLIAMPHDGTNINPHHTMLQDINNLANTPTAVATARQRCRRYVAGVYKSLGSAMITWSATNDLGPLRPVGSRGNMIVTRTPNIPWRSNT